MMKQLILLFVVFQLVFLACGLPYAATQIVDQVPASAWQTVEFTSTDLPTIETQPTPQLTQLPDATPILFPAVSPASVEINFDVKNITEEDIQANYRIELMKLVMIPADQSWAGVFNKKIDEWLDSIIISFKRDAGGNLKGDEINISFLTVNHEMTYTWNNWASLKFDVGIYITGAVHGMNTAYTFTYDAENNVFLELSDLFKPGVDYLPVLANYCKADLKKNGILETEEGADPNIENYKN
jgi:hypothetical protein